MSKESIYLLRFEPAANGIPSSVFFPQSDPEERLTQCSASLQALLGKILFLNLLPRTDNKFITIQINHQHFF